MTNHLYDMTKNMFNMSKNFMFNNNRYLVKNKQRMKIFTKLEKIIVVERSRNFLRYCFAIIGLKIFRSNIPYIIYGIWQVNGKINQKFI